MPVMTADVRRGLAIMATIENFVSARTILRAYSTDFDVIAARHWIAEMRIKPAIYRDPSASQPVPGIALERAALSEAIEDLQQLIAAKQKTLERLLARQRELESKQPAVRKTELATAGT